MGAILRVGPDRLWRPGQVKPTGIPRIDWSHPLANGLVLYLFDTGLGSIIELTRGDLVSPPATSEPALVSAYGAGLSIGKNLWGPVNSAPAVQQANNGSFTAAFACIGYSLTAYDTLFARSLPGVAGDSFPYWNWYFGNGGGGVTLTFATAPNIDTVGAVTMTAGLFYSIAATVTSSTADLYVNGQLNTSAANTVTNSNGAGDQPYLGGFQSEQEQIFYGLMYNRVLSQAELLQLHLDPYCFLLPQRSVFVVGTPPPPVGRLPLFALSEHPPIPLVHGPEPDFVFPNLTLPYSPAVGELTTFRNLQFADNHPPVSQRTQEFLFPWLTQDLNNVVLSLSQIRSTLAFTAAYRQPPYPPHTPEFIFPNNVLALQPYVLPFSTIIGVSEFIVNYRHPPRPPKGPDTLWPNIVNELSHVTGVPFFNPPVLFLPAPPLAFRLPEWLFANFFRAPSPGAIIPAAQFIRNIQPSLTEVRQTQPILTEVRQNGYTLQLIRALPPLLDK